MKPEHKRTIYCPTIPEDAGSDGTTLNDWNYCDCDGKTKKVNSTISAEYAKELEQKYGKKIYTTSKNSLEVV